MSIKERKYLYNVVEVNSNLELDYLNRNITEYDIDTAEVFEVTRVYRFRPDLISMRFYGNFHMGWLISLHNNLLDPIFDYDVGVRIEIPDLDSYFRYYNINSRTV